MYCWRRHEDRPSVPAAHGESGREAQRGSRVGVPESGGEPRFRWSGYPPSRRLSVSLLGAALAFLALPTFGTAQGPRRPPQPLQELTRALIEGRYDQVDALAEKLDSRDPLVVALKARAAIATGRYAEAETALRPVAARASTSEAALELGLLQHVLGQSDATATLTKVA